MGKRERVRERERERDCAQKWRSTSDQMYVGRGKGREREREGKKNLTLSNGKWHSQKSTGRRKKLQRERLGEVDTDRLYQRQRGRQGQVEEGTHRQTITKRGRERI